MNSKDKEEEFISAFEDSIAYLREKVIKLLKNDDYLFAYSLLCNLINIRDDLDRYIDFENEENEEEQNE